MPVFGLLFCEISIILSDGKGLYHPQQKTARLGQGKNGDHNGVYTKTVSAEFTCKKKNRNYLM
ncbi:hypothetical protein DWW78_06975 [Alistipes indistinctus]|nr:hypothetical protein DWW78_06975 [Alistipes indistinctus]